jgi:hypothetical protein
MALVESATSALVALGIGAVLVVVYFPFWRMLAVRSPRLATEGRPELLDEIERKPVHPSEPSSNVRRVES